MKNQKGITLIALVITIIVLLILAGITIAMLTGENGLLGKSQTAVADNAIGGAKDAVSTEVQAAMATYLENKYANNDNTTTAISTITTHLTKKWDTIATTGATISDATVKLNGSTITIERDKRTATGTVQSDGTLKWDPIQDKQS